MARMLAASIFALLGNALAVPSSTDEQLKASIIRRHAKDDSEIRMSSTGEMSVMGRQDNDPASDYCNHNYNLGTPNSNTCVKGVAITRPEDCVHAAANLKGYSAAPTETFTVADGWKNPLQYPKNCFISDDKKVYFNPTEGADPTTWQGTPVCERELYPNGKANADSSGSCPTDFEAIIDYNECRSAFSCSEGNSGCQMPDFENAAIVTSQTAPKGCYREANGCFNFNHNSGAPSGSVQGTAVCKLKL